MRLEDVAPADFNSWLRDPITSVLIETLRAEYHDLLRQSAGSVATNKIDDARVCAGRINEIESLLDMLKVVPENRAADPDTWQEDVEIEGDIVDPALQATPEHSQ